MDLRVRVDAKRYAQNPELQVIGGLDIGVAAGEFVALIGPSGCGKSTLLQIVAGLDRDFVGKIEGAGSGDARRLGYVFQNPRLLPWLTVRDNVRLVLDASADTDARVDDLLAAMDLGAFAAYHPQRISLGMQRRVALARAFAIRPELLLMDEPFVSLDLPTARLLRTLLLQLWGQERCRVLFVTHDLREATQLADRILFLSPCPARVIAEVGVDLPRHLRTVDTAVDRRWHELEQRFADLYPDPGPRTGAGSADDRGGTSDSARSRPAQYR